MITNQQRYAHAIDSIACDMAARGYQYIDEFELKKHYSITDLYEVSGLYLNTLSVSDIYEYVCNDDGFLDTSSALAVHMARSRKCWVSEGWRGVQSAGENIITSICDSLVKKTLHAVIRDLNDSLPYSIECLDESFKHSMITPAIMYHNL